MNYSGHRHYGDINVAELINDPFFQDWILHPTETDESFWRQWVKEHPEKEQVVEEARKTLLSIGFTTHWPTEEQVQGSLSRSLALLAHQESASFEVRNSTAVGPDRTRPVRDWVPRIGGWGKVAALLTGVLLLGTTWYILRHRNTEQAEITGYGMLKTIYLPDSSQVVLNAHSSLRYGRSWATNERREVWLDGEAFFEVRHGNSSGREGQRFAGFIVHTELLNVEVLGTSFDIRQRRGNLEVVLVTGKIKITSPVAGFETIWMNPGDRIRYDSAEHKIYRSSIAADEYVSWKDKKLVLTNAPLSGIIQYIEDNYGKTVVLQDPKMANRTIGGEIYLDNLQDALFILSQTLDVEIVDKGDTLLFKLK